MKSYLVEKMEELSLFDFGSDSSDILNIQNYFQIIHYGNSSELK